MKLKKMSNKTTHYISKDGIEYPKDEYSNHGYGGIYRNMKDLPKEGYPYTHKYAEDIRPEWMTKKHRKPLVPEGIVRAEIYGSKSSGEDYPNLDGKIFQGTWGEIGEQLTEHRKINPKIGVALIPKKK